MTTLTAQEIRVRERRLRSLAIIHDLSVRKSRRRDQSFWDFGMYWITDPHTSGLVAGGEFGLSLDEAEEWLTDYIALNPQTSVPGNPT